MFLHLAVVHLMSAGFTSVVTPVGNCLATDNASGEVAATGSAEGIVLTDVFFAGSSRAFNSFP